SPENVEPHRVANADAVSLVDALLDRHLELARRTAPEAAEDEPLVRLQMVPVGNRVLAPERTPPADILGRFEIPLPPSDAGHPGTNDRDELCRRPAREGVGQ